MIVIGKGFDTFMETLKSAKDERINGVTDWIVDASQIAMADDGTLSIPQPDGNVFVGTPSQWALSQLTEYLKIPGTYVSRMNTPNDIGLLATNVNYWLKKEQGNSRLIRTLTDPATKKRKLIAILSNKYRPIDNYDVVNTVLANPKIAGMQMKMHHAFVTEKSMSLMMYSTDKTYYIPGKENDGYFAGLSVRNSEVGYSAFEIEPVLVRLVCTNGMIYSRGYRKIHIGDRNVEGDYWSDETRRRLTNLIISQVNDTVNNAFDDAKIDDALMTLGETQKKVIKPTWVKFTGDEFGWTEEENKAIWDRIERNNRYEFIQAVTSYANDVLKAGNSPERAIELQKQAWELADDIKWKKLEEVKE